MKLKKYKKKSFGNYISVQLVMIILSIILSFVIINYVANKYNRVFLDIAEARIRKYLTEIINESTHNTDFNNKLFVMEKNSDEEIKMITYNSYEATKLINEITDNIQNKLYDKKENINETVYVISEIPAGVVFNNSLVRNLGPRIKVRMEMLGSVISQIETEVKPYGINNALIEVRINIVAKAKVVLPLASKEITVNNVIPISINIVNGKVPEAYISTYK